MSEPIQDQHLALLHPSSIKKGEMAIFETEGVRKNDALRLVHGDQHRWVYYPRMHKGEALIFQQYDTREEDPTLWGAYHNTMQDSTCPPGAPNRRSVEMRVEYLRGRSGCRQSQGQVHQAVPPGDEGVGDPGRAVPLAHSRR